MFDKLVKYPTGKYTIVVGIPLLVTMLPLFKQAKEINVEILGYFHMPSTFLDYRSLHGNQRQVWQCSY